MTATHVPADWNEILSTTLHNYHDTLTDNVFNTRPLLNHYMSNGRVKTIGGGVSIVEPVMPDFGQADSYSGWDTIEVDATTTAAAAQYAWKQLYATIAISGLEEAQNSGREQIINLLEAKIDQAEQTLKHRLNGMLFGTYRAGAAADAKDFLGLPVLIDDTVAAGGIDPGTPGDEYWAAKVQSAAGALDGAGLEKALTDLYLACSDAGPDEVDAIFTNAVGFALYETSLTPQVRYTDTDKANLGFKNLMFMNAPIMWDHQCPGGDAENDVSSTEANFYGINSKYIGLKIHRDRNFKQSPFTDNLSGTTAPGGGTAGQAVDARISFITTFGEHVTRNRRRNFKLTGVIPA